MNIELTLNTLDNKEWWFDLGISCQKTDYHPQKKYVFTISLVFFSVYVRWQNFSQVAELVRRTIRGLLAYRRGIQNNRHIGSNPVLTTKNKNYVDKNN